MCLFLSIGADCQGGHARLLGRPPTKTPPQYFFEEGDHNVLLPPTRRPDKLKHRIGGGVLLAVCQVLEAVGAYSPADSVATNPTLTPPSPMDDSDVSEGPPRAVWYPTNGHTEGKRRRIIGTRARNEKQRQLWQQSQ